MAAHVPRRVFARSFVVTVALVPACGNSSSDVHANPPPPTDTTSSTTTSATPAPTATATATAQATATATATNDTWTILNSNGKCVAALPDVSCPPSASCNPPPPTPYTCPANIPLNAYPLTVTRAAGSQQCTTTYRQHQPTGTCPPNAHCNPPPPREVTVNVSCPK